MSADQKSWGTCAVVKDLAVRDHAIRYSLQDLRQEAGRASCLVRLQLLQLRLDLWFGTVDVFNGVLTGVDDNRIGYVIYILDSENIAKVVVEFSGHLLIIGH